MCGRRQVEKQTLSLEDAAVVLGVSRAHAYRGVTDGSFPVRVLDISGKKRVSVADLERYLDPEASSAGSSCGSSWFGG